MRKLFLSHPLVLGIAILLGLLAGSGEVPAREPDRWLDVWPGHAPQETTADPGEPLPRRPAEDPPATRITGITHPRLAVFTPPAKVRSGAAIVVFPGGGYNYVVADKEGSETADWLNPLGVTVAVLHYRTKDGSDDPAWRRPVQDGLRAIRRLRDLASDPTQPWGLDSNKIGVLGFSAGGQAAALVATRFAIPHYDPVDAIDGISARPDFAMLIYPWQLTPPAARQLRPEIKITAETPPTFLLHAHDDRSSSMSSVLFYAELKRKEVPAELHILLAGGHGYGMRKVSGTNIHTWPDHGTAWLIALGLTAPPP